MLKKNLRYYLVQSLTLLVIALLCFLGYTITKTLTEPENTNDNTSYVSYEILTDNAMPVSKNSEQKDNNSTENNKDEGLARPYTSKDVRIGKTYYDYKAEEKNQEKSIVYYENTYIQNTGVDYVSKNTFDVNAVADGTVEKITEDDITGKTIRIKHNDNKIGVYQSVKDIKVKENDKITKGQVIAQSATNAIGESLGNHLHFELYDNNILVNPEIFFNQDKVE